MNREEMWEESLQAMGMPSRKRYNILVAAAANETKRGGDIAKSQIWATLALAEATLLAGEED